MTIALLSTIYPFRGGIAQFAGSLYRALEKRHRVFAFTFTRQYPGLLFPGATQYVSRDDRADAIPSEAVLDSINPISYWKTARRIARCRPDLLIVSYWMPFFAPSLGFVAGKLRKQARVLGLLHNVTPHEPRPGDRLLTRYFLDRCHGFVVMSRAVADDLLALRPDARYLLKPHPVYSHFGEPWPQQEARRALGLPKDRKLVLFFGLIRDYKGLDVALQAMRFLPRDVMLVVAGEVYGDFRRYQDLIDRHDLQDRVRLFLRYIPDEQVAQFFSAADVAVMPYKSATQSGTVQIAYHFRLPVIVSDVGGLSEMVEHGRTGLVIPEPSAEALAQAILRYFQNGLHGVFSQNMQEVAARHSWEAFARDLEAFALELTSGKPRHAAVPSEA